MRNGHTSRWNFLEPSGFSSCLMTSVMTKLNKDSTPLSPSTLEGCGCGQIRGTHIHVRKTKWGNQGWPVFSSMATRGQSRGSPGPLPWEDGKASQMGKHSHGRHPSSRTAVDLRGQPSSHSISLSMPVEYRKSSQRLHFESVSRWKGKGRVHSASSNCDH